MQALLGNFALILFVLMLVTGVIWFADTFFLSKQRRAAPTPPCRVRRRWRATGAGAQA